MRLARLTAFLSFTALVSAAEPPPLVTRSDHYVWSDRGIRLFVREVRAVSPPGTKSPVLLLHGARVPGVASFDLPVPGGSLAVDLATAGHTVYIMDARGYGRSTRPGAMSAAPEANPPLVRSPEVVRDVGAVVDWIRGRMGEPSPQNATSGRGPRTARAWPRTWFTPPASRSW